VRENESLCMLSEQFVYARMGREREWKKEEREGVRGREREKG
jgi:hypothetical protein